MRDTTIQLALRLGAWQERCAVTEEGRKEGKMTIPNSKEEKNKLKKAPSDKYIYIYSHVLEEQCHQCPMTYMSREDNLCSTPTWNRRRLQKEKGSFSVQAKSPRHTHEHTHFDRVHPVR